MSEKKSPDCVRGKLCFLIMKFDIDSEQDKDAFTEISAIFYRLGYIVVFDPLQFQLGRLSTKLLQTFIEEMMMCCSTVALVEKNEKNADGFAVNELMMIELAIAKKLKLKVINVIKDKENDSYIIGKGGK